MRAIRGATWMLVVIAAAGLVACGSSAEDATQAGAGKPVQERSLSRTSDVPPAVPPGEEVPAPKQDRAEARAQELLGMVAKAHREKDRAAYEQAVETLEREAWDAPSARRFAVKLGLAAAARAEQEEGESRIRRLDRARRLLSRGIWLPELFDEQNRPTAERDQLMERIATLNRAVMTFGRGSADGGLEGVTRSFQVESGWSPILIVSRLKLPYGPNAVLFWNEGHLRASGLQAGEWILLPEEPLTVVVNQDRRRLAIMIGDWVVKDFAVGIGTRDKPTPVGTFEVGRKRSENPDWWSPDGFIPYGDPRNELGSMWTGLRSEQVPEGAGYGLHGTNRPETVGTRCSNGCVRLANDHATELYRWIRGRDSNGGPPTEIVILPLS